MPNTMNANPPPQTLFRPLPSDGLFDLCARNALNFVLDCGLGDIRRLFPHLVDFDGELPAQPTHK